MPTGFGNLFAFTSWVAGITRTTTTALNRTVAVSVIANFTGTTPTNATSIYVSGAGGGLDAEL